MNSSDTPLIKIKNLSVSFDVGEEKELNALENINLDIYPHEYLILYGPSGCGKSTLLNVISGLQKPTSGAVTINNRDLGSFSEKEKLDFHRHWIGMIFQSFYLIPTLSVIDNVSLPRAFLNDSPAERRRDAMNFLKRVGVSNQAEKYPQDLSGGQRQRVAIARCLMNGPKIIVADEPVGNLDSKSAYNVLSILKELNEIDKKLVILVTHDPSHLAYGDRVIHMRDGKITKMEEIIEKKELRPDEEEMYLKEQEEMKKNWESFKEGKLGKALELYKKGELEKDWELVKKEELGKAWKAFKEGKLGDEWDIDKEYELVRKDEFQGRRKEQIAPDLLALMRSFRDLSPEQVGTLLIPYKAQQIFAHIFFQILQSQLEQAKKIFQDYIAGAITIEDVENRLILEEEKGGAGWDKYHARRLISGIQRIFEQVKKVDFSNIQQSADNLTDYLIGQFHLKLGSMEKIKVNEYVKMRLENELSMDEFFDLTDRPIVKGGIGLDRRTAVKVARELEIIMLARYSM